VGCIPIVGSVHTALQFPKYWFTLAVAPAHPAPEKSIRFINDISVQPIVS
jgi:hypothetical protein